MGRYGFGDWLRSRVHGTAYNWIAKSRAKSQANREVRTILNELKRDKRILQMRKRVYQDLLKEYKDDIDLSLFDQSFVQEHQPLLRRYLERKRSSKKSVEEKLNRVTKELEDVDSLLQVIEKYKERRERELTSAYRNRLWQNYGQLRHGLNSELVINPSARTEDETAGPSRLFRMGSWFQRRVNPRASYLNELIDHGVIQVRGYWDYRDLLRHPEIFALRLYTANLPEPYRSLRDQIYQTYVSLGEVPLPSHIQSAGPQTNRRGGLWSRFCNALYRLLFRTPATRLISYR
jgi:hypothetical protein